jgi:hypothetical protein
VLVVVIIVRGVAATVVDVIHVISMRNRDMATTLAMPMVMPLMHGVLTRRRLALVVMTVVLAVQVPVMDVIHVVSMRDSDVPAPLTMRVLMARMLEMRRSVGHLRFSFESRDPNRQPRRPANILTNAYTLAALRFGPLPPAAWKGWASHQLQ